MHCDARGPALDDDRLDDAVGAERVSASRARRPGAASRPVAQAAPSSRPQAHGASPVRRPRTSRSRVPDESTVAPISTPTDLDVVISLGGDGTMLRAVDLAYEAGVRCSA